MVLNGTGKKTTKKLGLDTSKVIICHVAIITLLSACMYIPGHYVQPMMSLHAKNSSITISTAAGNFLVGNILCILVV